MKKLILFTLALVCALSLSGCGKPDVKEDAPDNPGVSLDGILDGGADIAVDAVP